MQTFATKTEEGINIIVEKTKQILNRDQSNKDYSYYDTHDSKESMVINREMVDKSSESFVNVAQSDSVRSNNESKLFMII